MESGYRYSFDWSILKLFQDRRPVKALRKPERPHDQRVHFPRIAMQWIEEYHVGLGKNGRLDGPVRLKLQEGFGAGKTVK